MDPASDVGPGLDPARPDTDPALETRLRQLAHVRPSQRIQALADLIQSGAKILDLPQVQEALLATLDDPVKAVRRVAVEVVAQTARTRPRLAQHLRAALGSQQSNRRWAAAFALGQIGSPPSESLPVLLENLGHPDGDIRWSAHKLLVRLAPAEPRVRMEALRLAGGATDHTRKMALYLLRDLGTSDAELHRVVLAALQSPDHNVRLAAVNVLIKLRIDPPALLEQLRQLETADPVAGVRRAARAALGALA